MNVTNAVMPSSKQAVAFFMGPDDGPFTMLNLLRFKKHADYPDGSDAHLSGREAYARYREAVQSCLAAVGARQIYAGAVMDMLLGSVEEPWDMMTLIEYPSRAALLTMMQSPGYQMIEKHRHAGLDGQINIRTRATNQ